jgi:hypothetical protein
MTRSIGDKAGVSGYSLCKLPVCPACAAALQGQD